MSDSIVLTPEEMAAITGYRQRARQMAWLRDKLKLTPPQRADGSPVVSRAQLEAALAGRPGATVGPRWSKIAA